jgi:hypothetical protein
MEGGYARSDLPLIVKLGTADERALEVLLELDHQWPVETRQLLFRRRPRPTRARRGTGMTVHDLLKDRRLRSIFQNGPGLPVVLSVEPNHVLHVAEPSLVERARRVTTRR